ncbi:hypothetical protein AVEN_22334-1 [Araneus ventricosus]|uniref:Uncharacterized protein n=1 Tax=Araneus ventricosus TaxID=182803 RepID=A0A4Y2HCC7_ARAVE|nr:hypothetical protein AVEN_22334-1 [Araneus ventricosus]
MLCVPPRFKQAIIDSQREVMDRYSTETISSFVSELLPPFKLSKPPRSAMERDRSVGTVPSAPLTYLELFSRAKSRNKTIWLIPPVHHWYQGSRPGGCLSIDCNRRDQTTLTGFLSGHIRSLTFSDNSKCFEICPKCTSEQATPDHILACLWLSKQDLVSNPLLTLDLFRVHRLMDLI